MQNREKALRSEGKERKYSKSGAGERGTRQSGTSRGRGGPETNLAGSKYLKKKI